jgi:predicted amidohydrolase/GNAT superfamily N-acetyltransferase
MANTLKVGAFQFAGSNDIAENLKAIKRGIALAAADNVRLLLTQECALTGYPPLEAESVDAIDFEMADRAIEAIQSCAAAHHIFVALGTVVRQGKDVFNAVQMISPDDAVLPPYHKRALWGWDVENFKRGEQKGIYKIDGFRIGVRICYEVRFPEYFRELFLEGVDLCLVAFADFGAPEQQAKRAIIQSHLISRAAENAFYVLSANSLSSYPLAPTCFISPDGVYLKEAPLLEESLIWDEITAETPNFGRLGRIENTRMLLAPITSQTSAKCVDTTETKMKTPESEVDIPLSKVDSTATDATIEDVTKDATEIEIVRGTPEAFDAVYACFERDFPPSERKRKAHLIKLINAGRYQLWLANRRSSGEHIGYAFTYAISEYHVLWLDYIAIEAPFRSGGYGAMFFNALMAQHAKTARGVFIEVEIPTGEDFDQMRRVNFYERLGAVKLTDNYRLPSATGSGSVPMSLYYKTLSDGEALPSKAIILGAIQHAFNGIHNDLDHLDQVFEAVKQSI